MTTNQTNQNIKQGYKVFAGKRVLRPATEQALQRIRYHTNRWNEQGDDHGPFAVFEQLGQAQKFADSLTGVHIRAVEYIQSTEECLWKKNPPIFRSRGRISSGGTSERHITECPEGTQFASAVWVHAEEI